MARYELKETQSGTTELLEDGIAIAKVTKGRKARNFRHLPSAKFYTERAKSRFEDFADSLSIAETLEALGA